MKQVVQDIRRGGITVREIPDPVPGPGQVIVAAGASVISAGTERYVVDLARRSLLGKARQRPDHVRRVLQKVRQEGLLPTLSQVFAKLDEPMPLGYSSAGVVLECGRGVQELKPGDPVATAAPHAGVVSVGRNLCALVPAGLPPDRAAYAAIAAIALQGVRLTRTSLGERVLVIGLGLIGQICVSLLKAQGCRVFGTDVDPPKLELARLMGADEVGRGTPLEAVREFTRGKGVDAAVLSAATASNEPIEFAAEACRVRGRIVLVGVTGLNVPRDPFFRKELEFTVSSSLGPGRNDPAYEEAGIDYPFGFVRWTARRNMEAALEAMAAGQLPVERLTTHRFPVERAAEAYDLVTSRREPFVGIVLEYPPPPAEPRRRIGLSAPAAGPGDLGVSLVGVGNFARLVLLPALSKLGGVRWRGVCSARGLHAEHSGRKAGFAFACSDAGEVWGDPETHAVIVATRHDLHAEMVIAALRAGKHVFVEKPLCIRPEGLEAVASCVADLGDRCPVLMVGLNRRFAPATTRLREHFRGVSPLSTSYRFATPPVPADAWPQDEEVGGGRVVGEACHAIDTCLALVGSPFVKVYAESVALTKGLETADDRCHITLRHADGSVSHVSYQAGGDPAAAGERIEVFGGGRTGVVDGWDAVELWKGGRRERARGGKDKGHGHGLRAFLEACRSGGPWPVPWEDVYNTMWASLMAVRSLREGLPVSVDDPAETDAWE